MINKHLALVLAAFGLGFAPAALPAQTTLVNRYSFTTDASDAVGGPAGNGALAGGATIANGAVVLNGNGAYVDLPNGIIATLDSLSIETWLTDNNSGTWARLFDFGNSTGGENVPGNGTQYLFISPQAGAGNLRGSIATNGNGSEQTVEWAGTRLPAGALKQVVWTFAANSQIGRLYVDGVLVGENLGMSLRPADLGVTSNNWIGRSQWSGDPFLNATITEFRIYNGALTAGEVLTSFNNGPDVSGFSGAVQLLQQPYSQTVGELAPVTFTTTFSGTPPVGIQWRRNGLNLAGATNTTYTLAAAALTNNAAAYSVVLSNQYLGSPATATSSNAILTVTADTTPPALWHAASLFPNEVLVTFSEGVSDSTGTNSANYIITRAGGSLAVSAARFGATTAEIILTTAPQSLGTNYTLTVSNVRDRAAAANLVAPGSQTNFAAISFVGTDIGNPPTVGLLSPVSGGMDVTASGRGISGTSDQFTFSYQSYTNNFDVRVRVASLGFVGTWTRAALMARNGLATNAMFAASVATPGPAGCHFESRLNVGGNTALAGTFPVNYPDTWLRLRRVGNVFEGFASLDGVSWEYLGSSTIVMSNRVQVGFALTAGSPVGSTTAQFRDFANASGNITTNAPLPFEPLGPSSRRTALVISEIMYNPRNSWEGANNLEFIELWNSGLITEDLTGHKFTGEISYTFPANTKLAPGQFLVIAQDPAAAQSFYGGPFFGPYEGRLSNSGGIVRLHNELGGILLEIEYDTKSPWPVAADGAGHSLVLSHPSYGENDPRAWSASDVVGGSPRAFEHYGSELARGVVINEFLAHTDDPQVDYIELFNPGKQAVNLSGAWLSDEAGTNKYQIANGTSIPARGFLAFTQTQLGFALAADGEKLLLVNSNQTRVLDAVNFDGQENGVSMGRYPNGAPGLQRLASVTPGTGNTLPRLSPLVINEIMYHPISRDDNDEYVELYNRSGSAVNLGGWRLQDGISFTFPSNTVIAAGGYLVIAANVTNLLAKYPQLNAANTFGNFNGKLSNNGERLALARPDDLVVANGLGGLTTNIYYFTVSEVSYQDGGRWGKWSDGGGSALELIDPDADPRLAPNWADSDESAKAAWTSIDVTEVMENGQTGIVNEGSGSQATANRFELFLQGEGEALVDNLEFRSNGGANLIANGNFTSGTTSWGLGGVLRNSFSQTGVGVGGSTALHLVATGRGDTGPNKISRSLSATAATGAPNTSTMRAQARWLKGNPYILLRMRGNWMEVSQRLNLPANLGSPGLANSRLVANAGPAIAAVTHTPVLPAANQPVVVTARATDPDGISSLTLNYRIDPAAGYTAVSMFDNGTSGDVVAQDGIYSATVPGQATGVLGAFYVTAVDSLGAANQFPAAAPTRECHVRWGETTIAGSLGTYRLWVTAANISFWGSRERNANDPIDATFVYGNQRVIYNVDTMYSGSPFHTPAYNGPLEQIACDYEVNFPSDEKFLGAKPIVLTAYDVVSGNFFFNDDSGQVDLTGTWIARKLGQPYNHRRHVHVVMNGLRRGTIYDDAQQPNSELLAQYFPDDETGQLRKIESWFEFAGDAQNQGSVYATLARVNKSTGAIDPKRYRWNWRPRATENPDDWAPFTNLVAAVNATTAPNYAELVRTWMDVPNFLRPIITHHICGSWDSYAYERGKNMYAYKPDGEPWRLLMWDIEIALGAGGNGPTDSIYNMFDTVLRNMILNTPAFHREYLRGFQEALDTALAPGAANLMLDERYSAFQQNNVPLISPQFIKNYLASRRAHLLTVLPNAAFAVSNPAYQVVAGSNVLTLSGTGPLAVENILVNSNAYAVTWTSTINWSVRVPLAGGTNLLTVSATDRSGQVITNATASVTAQYTGPTVAPEGFVVFNEILYRPVTPGTAFVELFNAHPDFTFDLSGWRLNGLGYDFPSGATLAPQRFLVLAADSLTYNQSYGGTNLAFDGFSGTLDNDGETLTLFRPGAGTNLIVVDRLRYGTTAPWPVITNGASLQLRDVAQDNSRVANWSIPSGVANLATPGKVNSVVTNLPAFAPLWLNELQANNVTGPLDNFSQHDPWMEIFNSAGTNVGLAGYYLTDTYTNLTKWAFPGGATAASGFTLVWCDNQPGQTTATALHAGLTLASGNGSLALTRIINGAPQVVDYLNYSELPANWTYGNVPDAQPFYRRPMFYATPGATNNGASAPLTVFINEWMADNTVTRADPADGQYEDWLELYNPGPNAVDVGGYFLTDDLADKFKFEIPDNGHYVIPAGSYLLVWADNESNQNSTNRTDLHVGFALGKGGEALGLFAADGTTIDAVTFGAQISDVSEGRFPNGAANVYAMPTPTPRAANIVPNASPSLAAITNRVVTLGQTLSLTVLGSDSDVPAQTLAYSFANAPLGATIGSSSGMISWTSGQAPATNHFSVVVTDNGTPSMSATQSFTVTVIPPPTLGNITLNGTNLTFTWLSAPGQFYQIEYKNDLSDPEWLPLGAVLVGTGGSLNFTNSMAGSPRRFFRLRVLSLNQALLVRPALEGDVMNALQFVLTWPTLPGQRFQVEAATNFANIGWMPLGNPLTGSGDVLRYTNNFGDSPQRYFRLLVLSP